MQTSSPLNIPSLTLLFTLVVCPAQSFAKSFSIRSTSSTSLRQQQRLDTTIDAPRQLNQGFELHLYDLLDSHTSPLHTHASFRFQYDLSTTSSSSIPLLVDTLYAQWRPTSMLSMNAGRTWVSSSLGLRDIDGVQLQLSLPTSQVRTTLTTFAGLDVQSPSSWLAPTTFDVQGLPLLNDTTNTSNHTLLLGASSTIRTPRMLAIQTSYQRRTNPAEHTLHEERAGLLLAITPRPFTQTHTHIIYNAILRRAELIDVTQFINFDHHTKSSSISLNASRRRPWFDSSSIFNLFDPSPHDDLAISASHSPHRILTIQAKTWLRHYHGDASSRDWLTLSNTDARSIGGSLSQSTRIPLKHQQLAISTRASTQHTRPQSSLYPAQWLLDQRLDLQPYNNAFPTVFARQLLLHTRQPVPHHRLPEQAIASSSIIGVDTQHLSNARLSLQLEYRTGSNTLTSFNAYATLTLTQFN